MALLEYDLGENIVAVADPRPLNYSKAFDVWKNAVDNQRNLISELGFADSFDQRVLLAGNNGRHIVEIVDDSHAGYDGVQTHLSLHAAFTKRRNAPLIFPSADCPILMVSGKEYIGMVHAGRQELDERFVLEFFRQFPEPAEDIKVAVSPYIAPDNFAHVYLDLDRWSEWFDARAVSSKANGLEKLDLGNMVLYDLKSVGIDDVIDKKIDTFELARRAPAYDPRNSHRFCYNRKMHAYEGRMGIVMVKK